MEIKKILELLLYILEIVVSVISTIYGYVKEKRAAAAMYMKK